ncbi:MAG: hypothetical protein JJ916_10200 [Phycisphaerales bacterium]|nr:hypothetical protein [Phycisphaerales bacterium]
MYTPKERCQLLLSMLGEQLNEHGHFFKISKTRLYWKNKDVSVFVFPRGSHYSEAEITKRWLSIRIDSYAMRKLARAGAPVSGGTISRGAETLYEGDLRTPDSPGSVEVTLTDWWSIEEAAKYLAPHFDDFWHNELAAWLSLDSAITELSTNARQDFLSAILLGSTPPEQGLTVLWAPGAPAAGSSELRELIHEHKLDEKEWRLNLIGELLLASNRDDDFWRLVEFGSMCKDRSKHKSGQYRGLMALADWKRANEAV